MPPKGAKFVDGERVLCFHGPLMYEAKCIKAEAKENSKSPHFLIHYNGWNKHWDEWVPESRVLKYNEANLHKQKDLMKLHGKDKVKRGKPSKLSRSERDKDTPDRSRKNETSLSSPSIEPKRKRSRFESTVESEDNYNSKVEINIVIPDLLKGTLVEDWDLVSRQKHIYRLPANVTVDDILKTYVDSVESAVERQSALTEFASGIKEYFNLMLHSQLLYKLERSQHEEIVKMHPEKTVTQIYGISHLLRLFVKVGAMLVYTDLDEKNTSVLVNHVHNFLHYLEENIHLLFNPDDYHLGEHLLKKAV